MADRRPVFVEYRGGQHLLVQGAVEHVTADDFRQSFMSLEQAAAKLSDVADAGVPDTYFTVTFGPIPAAPRRPRRYRRRPRSVERWEALSEPYRRRLRGAWGVHARRRYLRGDSLEAARGHRRPQVDAELAADPYAHSDELRRRYPRAEARLFVGEALHPARRYRRTFRPRRRR